MNDGERYYNPAMTADGMAIINEILRHLRRLEAKLDKIQEDVDGLYGAVDDIART